MERAELINHLEHLAEYVKYSEDAPALREAIALLKTHEKRTETHACDLIQSTMGQVNDTVQSTNDCISRQSAIDALDCIGGVEEVLRSLPPAQPKPSEISYKDCANAMLKMWIDEVLTDGEYNRIMDKLNAHWAERREE